MRTAVQDRKAHVEALCAILVDNTLSSTNSALFVDAVKQNGQLVVDKVQSIPRPKSSGAEQETHHHTPNHQSNDTHIVPKKWLDHQSVVLAADCSFSFCFLFISIMLFYKGHKVPQTTAKLSIFWCLPFVAGISHVGD